MAQATLCGLDTSCIPLPVASIDATGDQESHHTLDQNHPEQLHISDLDQTAEPFSAPIARDNRRERLVKLVKRCVSTITIGWIRFRRLISESRHNSYTVM